jgi:putative endonuclease
VARRGATLVFVEVKTRRARRFGLPEEAVDARKQARVVRGARAWLQAHAARARRVRFDVVACEVGDDGAWRVRHLEGAFDAG